MEQEIKISLINCIKFVRMFHEDCLYFIFFFVYLPNIFGLAYLEKQHQENE